MFRFFKKQRPQSAKIDESPQYGTAPGTEIRYHPELIKQLKADHQAVFNLYQEIKTALEQDKLESVAEKLTIFQTQLHDHLLNENVRLYAYLEACFAHDSTQHELIRGFRQEMNGIAKNARGFLKKYAELAEKPELHAHFMPELNATWGVFADRLRREEQNLYPLYRPPSS